MKITGCAAVLETKSKKTLCDDGKARRVMFADGAFTGPIISLCRGKAKTRLHLNHVMRGKPFASAEDETLDFWIEGKRLLFNADISERTEAGRKLAALIRECPNLCNGVSVGVEALCQGVTDDLKHVVNVDKLREITLCVGTNRPAFAYTWFKPGFQIPRDSRMRRGMMHRNMSTCAPFSLPGDVAAVRERFGMSPSLMERRHELMKQRISAYCGTR